MDDKQHRFLGLGGRLPARLSVEQVAWLLNCRPEAIAALLAARLLKPLGNPPPNGIKFFFTADVLEAIKDRSWMTKVTNAILQDTKEHNDRRNHRSVEPLRNGHPPVPVRSATVGED